MRVAGRYAECTVQSWHSMNVIEIRYTKCVASTRSVLSEICQRRTGLATCIQMCGGNMGTMSTSTRDPQHSCLQRRRNKLSSPCTCAKCSALYSTQDIHQPSMVMYRRELLTHRMQTCTATVRCRMTLHQRLLHASNNSTGRVDRYTVCEAHT